MRESNKGGREKPGHCWLSLFVVNGVVGKPFNTTTYISPVAKNVILRDSAVSRGSPTLFDNAIYYIQLSDLCVQIRSSERRRHRKNAVQEFL